MGKRKRVKPVDNKNTVTIRRRAGGSNSFPPFVELGHKHLEKEAATPAGKPGRITFNVPVDLLRMVMPPEQVDAIESVEFTYFREAP